MGRYAGAVQAAKSFPNNLAAIDFTNWDEVNGVIINEGGAFNAGNATPINGPIRTPEGVIVDGITQRLAFKVSTQNIKPSSWVLIYKPLDGGPSGVVVDGGSGQAGTTRTIGATDYTDERVRVDAYGDTYTSLAGEQTKENICVVGVGNREAFSSAAYYGLLEFSKAEYNIGSPSLLTSSDWWVSLGGTRNGGSFAKAEIMFFAMWNDQRLDLADMRTIFDTYNYYARLILSTNLEASRHQTVLSLGPLREVANTSPVFPNETDLNIYLSVENGQLVEFFAFDSDEARTNLTTGPIVPNELEPLVFNPVAGGAVDPGTGLLAHISGTVNIDGNPAARQVIVISDDPNGRTVLGEGLSAADGTFDIEYSDWGGAVIALAIDVYGGDWSSETPLASGTIIHPTAPNGYVYEVTSGGTTGTTEPTWSTTDPVNDGSVTYSPKAFYRPIASGPLQGEILQDGTQPEPTPGPTPYRYFRINITANNGDTYTGLNEIELRGTQAGADITTPTTVVTTTSEFSLNSNYVIENVHDDDPLTIWFNEAGVLPLTIEIDLGSEQGVAWLSMLRGNVSDPALMNQCPKDFTVEASTNGTDWVNLATFANVTDWVADDPYLFALQAE